MFSLAAAEAVIFAVCNFCYLKWNILWIHWSIILFNYIILPNWCIGTKHQTERSKRCLQYTLHSRSELKCQLNVVHMGGRKFFRALEGCQFILYNSLPCIWTYFTIFNYVGTGKHIIFKFLKMSIWVKNEQLGKNEQMGK